MTGNYNCLGPGWWPQVGLVMDVYLTLIVTTSWITTPFNSNWKWRHHLGNWNQLHNWPIKCLCMCGQMIEFNSTDLWESVDFILAMKQVKSMIQWWSNVKIIHLLSHFQLPSQGGMMPASGIIIVTMIQWLCTRPNKMSNETYYCFGPVKNSIDWR